MLKKRMKTKHPGPASQLKPIEGPLLCYIFEQREQGMAVATFDLAVKASTLSTEFRAKHFTARCSAIRRFLSAHSIVY